MNTSNSPLSATLAGHCGRFLQRRGPLSSQHHEREWLFFSFLLILTLGYAAFAMVSWQLDFEGGVLANGLGILAMLALGGLRLAHVRLSLLITALQILTLAQAFCITWLTGGIYSATISWLALAPLPAVLAYRQGARIAGLAVGWLLILGLYGYALLGGEMALQIRPQDLIHWHLMMAIVIFGMQLALLFRMNSVRNERMQRAQQQRRKLRQLTKNMQHTQQQKDLFVASVSHELRTPMNAILGLADLIHHDKRLDDEVRSKIEVIQKSGEHLLTIINDLLDHSQMQAGRLQVEQAPFNLHETLLSSFQLLKRRAATKPLQYTLHMTPDLPQWIVGDSHRLTQILVNLLGNAIKFTTQGEIELHCSLLPAQEDPPTPCTIRLAVRDTGMGIAPELQHRVFQSFSQADSSIARRFGGNGLGLSITKGLVEAMGGAIGFESQVGLGTTFHVTLPCTLSHAPAYAQALVETENSEKAVRILIADDNPLNRQIASLQLRRHLPQAQVTEVANGLEAFEAVRDSDGFDVVLMDLLMPEMDGQTSARKIRSELPEPQRSTPIIALTANADKDELARCLEAGMNESMLKPFNRSLLVKRVLSYVA
ncbi:MAG: ATP-binding protein [Pseudomonadota bacterium]|jgi:signal transduction histidine kinase/CheY-like chemotaxis protein